MPGRRDRGTHTRTKWWRDRAPGAADNPGQWVIHCHNAYHGGAGMMTTMSYQA